MLVTVFCAPRDRPEITFSLDVSPELELRDFVALCELESGIPATDIQITYAEQPLQDPTRALGAYGLKDGDVVVLRQAERRPPPQPAFPGLPHIDFSSIAVPGTSSGRRPTSQQRQTPNAQQQRQQQQQQQPQQQQPQQQEPQQLEPEQSPVPPPPPSLTGSASSPQGLDDPALLREMLLANPHELSLLKERNPPLAEALLSGDLERFTKVLLEQQQERARREQERIRLLTADPFDLEAQAKIEEDIRQHNIEENMTIAMEEAPESFGQVVMLYINCKVNGHPVKAFVDSGAQMTIMSQACAERCNIMRLVDRRWAGIAKGVGTQKIIGRVHLAQVQIEGDFLPCSFSILEDQPMDMLLGLDMLKRHQCSIDLKKSVLLIGTTGSETRFLPEAELPECARLAYGADTRPDEIADRELAEALQRSVQESDIEDGQTTSPPVQPCPLSTPSDKTSLTPSPPPGHAPNPALDRSQSAPASLPPPPPPPQGVTASGSRQSHLPFLGLPGPAPPIPDTLEAQDPQAMPQGPPPSTAGPDPLPRPPPASLDPPTSALKVATNTDNAESLAPTAMEVGVTGGGEGSGSSALLSLPHPGPLTLQTGSELEMTQSTDAKNTRANVWGERGDEEEEREGVEMDGVCGEGPCTSPPDAKLQPSLSVHNEHFASGPSLDPAMDSPIDAQATVQVERDQAEGEQQLNSDPMPSLAAALKELHQLLVANSRMLSQERSPSPSPPPSPSPSCREVTDGVHDSPVSQSGPATVECVQSPTPTPETIATEPEQVPNPLPDLSADFSGYEGSPGRGEGEAVDGEKVSGGSEVHGEKVPRGSKVHGELMENMEGRAETGPEVATPTPSPPQQGLELREPPEGQQGRGVADGRAPNPLPSPMEVTPQNALLTTTDPPSPAPVMPDKDSRQVSQPLPPASIPCQSSSSSSATPLPRAPSECFPAAHIQKIQAAGFSASEAAEALEQVQGHVELALLMLLARKITVPS